MVVNYKRLLRLHCFIDVPEDLIKTLFYYINLSKNAIPPLHKTYYLIIIRTIR